MILLLMLIVASSLFIAQNEVNKTVSKEVVRLELRKVGEYLAAKIDDLSMTGGYTEAYVKIPSRIGVYSYSVDALSDRLVLRTEKNTSVEVRLKSLPESSRGNIIGSMFSLSDVHSISHDSDKKLIILR